MARTITLTDATFKAEVCESDKPVLVDFWSARSSDCAAMAPVLDDVAHRLSGTIRVATVDTESNPTTTQSFGVRLLPTLILFKNGKPATRYVGLLDGDRLVAALTPHLW